jgi:hypothetical protein
MSIVTTGLTGAVLNFANSVVRTIDGLRLIRVTDTADELPNPTAWDRRQAWLKGTGLLTAIDGQWFKSDGSAL